MLAKTSKFDVEDEGCNENASFRAIERDLEKYTDRRIKELYNQAILVDKAADRACSSNAIAGKTPVGKNLEFNAIGNFGRIENHEVLRQLIADYGNKSKQQPSSIYQKLQKHSQKPCMHDYYASCVLKL